MSEKQPLMFSFPRLSPPMLAILLMMISAGCGQRPSNSSSQATAAEADNYKTNIELTHIGLAKGESFLGDHVYYVEGKVKNTGNRVVQRIELTFVFKDNLNQVVLKESRKAMEYKGGGGLEPQQTNNFQVAFDHLPKDWNHIIPELEVSKIFLK
jgi:hypothetical protein